MSEAQTTALHRWGPTIAGGPITGFVGYFLAKVLDVWGVLDGPAKQLGEFLKAHVTGADLSMWIGFVFFALLYALILRWAWGTSQKERRATAQPSPPTPTNTYEALAAFSREKKEAQQAKPRLSAAEEETAKDLLYKLDQIIRTRLHPHLINLFQTFPMAIITYENYRDGQPAWQEAFEAKLEAQNLTVRNDYIVRRIGLDLSELWNTMDAYAPTLGEFYHRARDLEQTNRQPYALYQAVAAPAAKAQQLDNAVSAALSRIESARSQLD